MSRCRQADEALRESEDRYRSVYDALHEGLVLQDADGNIRAVNASAERILGRSAEQMMGRTSHDAEWQAIHEDGSPFPSETHPIVVSLATGHAQHGVIIGMQKPDATLAWLSVNSQPLFRNGEATPYAAVASFIDITDLKRLEQLVRESEERYHSLFEHSLDAILLTNPDGTILAANPAATLMFRRSEAELIQAGRSGIIDATDPRLHALLDERARTGKAKGELRLKRGDGTVFPVELSSTIFRDSAGRPYTSMFIRDITEQQRLTQELTNLAFYDFLTGLPNRPLFMDRLNQRLQHVKREATRRFAVLFIDLDNFKDINDCLGHAAGDQVLIEVADRLRTCVGHKDTISRLGGDEFTILLDDTSELSRATIIADRIQAVLTQPIYLSGQVVLITASLGLTIGTAGYSSVEQLLQDADTAMYQAKHAGKARYVISAEALSLVADAP
jgi:diguanylate cyclase (GGDEF)-like protein/PAS domain S-box-containing protein